MGSPVLKECFCVTKVATHKYKRNLLLIVDPAAPALKGGYHLPNPVMAARVEARRAQSEEAAKEGLPARTTGVSKLGRVSDPAKSKAAQLGNYLS